MAIPPVPRSALDPDPFIQARPTAHAALTSAMEKGGFQQRGALVHEFPTSNISSSPSEDAVSDTSLAQPRPVAADPDAQQALERSLILERRLDNLIHTLANHGETESNPPEYDGNATHRTSEDEERA